MSKYLLKNLVLLTGVTFVMISGPALAELIEIDIEVTLDPSQIYDCGGGAYPAGTMCWTNNLVPPVPNIPPRLVDASSDQFVLNVTFANNQAIRWATDGVSVPIFGDENVQISLGGLSHQQCCAGTVDNELLFDITGVGELNYNNLQWTVSVQGGGITSHSYDSGLTNLTDSFFEIRGLTAKIGPYINAAAQPYLLERAVITLGSGVFSYVTLPVDLDTDGDFLLDRWESDGIDFDNDGTIDLDLPAMGADPMHKDIFIELDYMVLEGVDGHTHEPKPGALQVVIDAFANAPVSNPDGTTGIRAHIDAGRDSIMDPVTNAQWLDRSRSNPLTHQDYLSSTEQCFNWSEFDNIKGVGTSGNFDVERASVFHYGVFVHNLCPGVGYSGISRGIPASDFIVSLGGWANTINQQAGTLMHEVGHNLGLKHGGDDHWNYEPNYLSVMNYFFQTRGLRISGLDGTIDYSRFKLPALDENALDESQGISGLSGTENYGTRFCDVPDSDGNLRVAIVDSINGPIDWDSDGVIASDVSQNINGPCYIRGAAADLSVLDNSDNWDEIVFDGGAIGQLGEEIQLPVEIDEPGLVDITVEEDAAIYTEYAVSVIGPSMVYLAPGKSVEYTYKISNIGELPDTITIDASSSVSWSSVSHLPKSIGFNPGESQFIKVTTDVPIGTDIGVTGSLIVAATSDANSAMMDQVKTTTLASVAAIDVMPGSARNPIRIRGKRQIPVVILGSNTFDVATIDGASVEFGPAGARPNHGPNAHLEGEDVNLDGYLDREFHFDVAATGLVSGDTQVCLTGMTIDGVAFGDCEIVDVR